ncbi:porin [Sphingobium lignivorans]|uniref:Phosphate-selective porin OprO/OprP n=1 Tax=Sphingobium lignivorans TaxID=2735886 RepID=A0ABR6NC93_9SPHN|nr:porin [Sphingobium lignivorans]MBB5984888.1 phosphate-selective porin OprO/OprP [Sphingobium lignivorans]
MAVLLAASMLSVPATPAMAQDDAAVAAMRDEIARLRAQVAALEERLDLMAAEGSKTGSTPPSAPLSASLTTSQPAPERVASASGSAQPPALAVPAASPPAPAPASGFTLKPRGRLQFDGNIVSRPAGMTEPTLGWSTDVRRAFLGVEGNFGGGLGYRFEMDFASGDPLFTDLWLTYKKGSWTVTLGHDRMTTLEDLTSDLQTSFLERSGFIQAFGFERRLGLSAAYKDSDVVLSAGIYSDDLETLGSGVADNSYSLDTRWVYMPKLGKVQLHLGGSLHHRELNDLADSLRYRARPGARTTSARFVDTGSFSASAETGYGIEFAALRGPFHVAAESYWQNVDRPNLADPTFFGIYGEIGYVFAGGEARGYRAGSFSSIKPTKGIDKGGAGAWQVNLRYDWLDLNDAGVRGGEQAIAGLSLIWVPLEHVKFMANYLHVDVRDTPILSDGRDDYDADVFGLRAQYDF